MSEAKTPRREPSRARVRVAGWGQSMARRMGYEIHPFIPDRGEVARRGKLLKHLGVTLVLDVGAATGVYVNQLRRIGYTGRVVSFEPLSSAYAKLSKNAASDESWETRKQGVGPSVGTSEIHVSANFDSSSFLEMSDRHTQSSPDSAYVDTETVEVTTLDTIWNEIATPEDRVYLKLDVQGYELEVMRGAEAALPQVVAMQAELSLQPLYEGAPLYGEVIDHLAERGFRLAGFEQGFEDLDTGETLQVDGVFVRADAR